MKSKATRSPNRLSFGTSQQVICSCFTSKLIALLSYAIQVVNVISLFLKLFSPKQNILQSSRVFCHLWFYSWDVRWTPAQVDSENAYYWFVLGVFWHLVLLLMLCSLCLYFLLYIVCHYFSLVCVIIAPFLMEEGSLVSTKGIMRCMFILHVTLDLYMALNIPILCAPSGFMRTLSPPS